MNVEFYPTAKLGVKTAALSSIADLKKEPGCLVAEISSGVPVMSTTDTGVSACLQALLSGSGLLCK